VRREHTDGFGQEKASIARREIRYEPDIEIKTLPGDMLQVEIRGMDIFDPTTGRCAPPVARNC
jgi:hypothetical protein